MTFTISQSNDILVLVKYVDGIDLAAHGDSCLGSECLGAVYLRYQAVHSAAESRLAATFTWAVPAVPAVPSIRVTASSLRSASITSA